MTDHDFDERSGRPSYHQEVQHSSATARVPERVGLGVFSTGTIVMHGPHEFLIDFLQSLAPPRRVAARVVLPPTVIPLLLAALQDNFSKYTQTFGPLPRMPIPRHSHSATGPAAGPGTPAGAATPLAGETQPVSEGADDAVGTAEGGESAARHSSANAPPIQMGASGGGTPGQGVAGHSAGGPPAADHEGESTPFPLEHHSPGSQRVPHPAPIPIAEVYEQLKLPDDMLSGHYANTVVISHTGAEFCLDFITSFFPRSAVAARIYMACPHVLELFESLNRSWDQFRHRSR